MPDGGEFIPRHTTREQPADGDGGGSGGSNNNNGKLKGKEKVVPEYGKNRHGMPVGFYFVPMDLELFAILMCKLVRGEVPGALNNVFEHIRILEFHPALLRETYIENMEDRCIYFFSRRLFAAKARNKRQPMRVANGGTWKASGGSKTVRSKKVGGIDVGQKLTMVFYERRFEGDQNPVKTNWAMHEYTKIIPSSKNQVVLGPCRVPPVQDQKEGGHRAGERCRRGVEHGQALHAGGTATAYATATAIAEHGRIIVGNVATATAIARPGWVVVDDAAGTATAAAWPARVVGGDVALPGLAGEMTSMADQANMASTSQASAPSSELPQDWYDEYEVAYGAAAPPSPSTISCAALPSSPTAWWPSSIGGPVQHDGYLGMADPASCNTLEHLLPSAAIPPEPMAPPKNSPAAPPPADAGGNYDHPELADYGGGVQAQHEHHQPQELTDGADGDAQLELGAAEFDSERVAEMISQIMDGEFVFKFEDDTIVSFNEVAAAPMLIDGGGDGDGDGADGGVGDDPFDN
ncbi:hypothetical protein DAI22_10g089100 [Oryza sativa Japonica Group]|nr:hypothetical protein DAI22_10g089100 [Oryza sativa Japonica Group]